MTPEPPTIRFTAPVAGFYAFPFPAQHRDPDAELRDMMLHGPCLACGTARMTFRMTTLDGITHHGLFCPTCSTGDIEPDTTADTP